MTVCFYPEIQSLENTILCQFCANVITFKISFQTSKKTPFQVRGPSIYSVCTIFIGWNIYEQARNSATSKHRNREKSVIARVRNFLEAKYWKNASCFLKSFIMVSAIQRTFSDGPYKAFLSSLETK